VPARRSAFQHAGVAKSRSLFVVTPPPAIDPSASILQQA